MTTATLPHGHSAARPARRGFRLFLAIALAASTAPALAFEPVDNTAPANTAASLAPLDAVAPVDLASPDNAPLAAQIAALRDAQDSPTASARIKTVLGQKAAEAAK